MTPQRAVRSPPHRRRRCQQLQGKIMHPQRPAAVGSQLIAALRQHAHTHALQHRQRVRQCDRRTAAIQLESQASWRSFEWPIQIKRKALCFAVQRRESANVGDRLPRRHRFFVGSGKRRAETLVQRRRLPFALFVIQRFTQIVFPASRGIGQLRLDCTPVDLRAPCPASSVR